LNASKTFLLCINFFQSLLEFLRRTIKAMADLKTPVSTQSPNKGQTTDYPKSSPLKASTDAPPESPTTARPLDFDDEAQETGTTETDSTPAPPPKDAASTKPARPISQREQNENTLREAFPTIDAAVVKAVLTASRGEVEPAFNALLGMSDPDAAKETEVPPAKPPRPTAKLTQLEADEKYARQLAEHYSGVNDQNRTPRTSSRYNENLQGSRIGKPGANPNPDDVPWRSFIDGERNPRMRPTLGDQVSSHWTPLDDLPEIRDNIKKGFFETQSTVNKWLGNLKKKIDGEEDGGDFDSQPARPAQGYNQQSYGRRSGDYARRSADMSRYDADPEVLGDDFSKLEMRDSEAAPKKPARPLANPDLFRTASGAKSPSGSRKVSFQNGPPEEIKDRDMYGSATTPAQPTSANKSSKWQPLSTVEPSPVAENDPFSLDDSDEEKDAKPMEMKEDDEHERVQKATADAMKDDIGDPQGTATK
jgi:hypothetical protein